MKKVEKIPLEEVLSPLQQHPIVVLMVDDQQIFAEAVKNMLQDQKDITFHYCSSPDKAVAMARDVKPTVILQDLVMPKINGMDLLERYNNDVALAEVPVVVLSTHDEPEIKAQAFAKGAHDYLVKLPDKVELLARIRHHSNSYIYFLERNEAHEKLEKSQKVILSELHEAADYVTSVLPPKEKHESLEVDWKFIPSMELGGDIFGYHWLDDTHFAIYLVDVCGHGVGTALLSISILNVLRARSLTETNFYNPEDVLSALNVVFPMEKHKNMFFTIWYGVYNIKDRSMIYCSGGHPPALLMTGESRKSAELQELTTGGMIIGGMPDVTFSNKKIVVERFGELFIFSDGAFELKKTDGAMLRFEEFVTAVRGMTLEGTASVDNIVKFGYDTQEDTRFMDDFSLIKVTFS
jgi:phosphoserine phosphatase RsbU/P